MPRPDYESLARQLDETGEFKVLRRFVPRPSYGEAEQGEETRAALFVDVETTGMHWSADRIIEFAGVPFTFGKDSGRIVSVGAPFVSLEDPGRPVPPEIVRLTHITDAMVAGQRIDDAQVKASSTTRNSSLRTMPGLTVRSWRRGSRSSRTRPGRAPSTTCRGMRTAWDR